MKKLFSIALLILEVLTADAQMTAGLTGRPDTSFSVNSEFLKVKKKYPDIRLVTELPRGSVREKRNIEYCKVDGRSLKLDVFRPVRQGKKKGPAILIIHGGGWRSGNRGQHIPLAQRLALKGYVCFTAEYRLSTEALYPAAVNDLKDAIRWIRANARQYGADGSKIAVLGFSAGGQLAALLGTTGGSTLFEGNRCNGNTSAEVQAVIDIDGTLSFVHPGSGEGDDSKSISAATYWFGYSKKERPDLWNEASPLSHAGKDTPPFLFLNSSVDRMHAGRDDFRKILNSYHIFSEVHTFAGAPHSFCLFEPWFTPTVGYICDFMSKIFAAK